MCCPASITGEIAPASNVFDTAISVTDARSRRACLQARAISCSTAARPLGECGVSGVVVWCAMSSAGRKFTGWFEFYQIPERLFEPFPLPWHMGWDKDVGRYFQ